MQERIQSGSYQLIHSGEHHRTIEEGLKVTREHKSMGLWGVGCGLRGSTSQGSFQHHLFGFGSIYLPPF